MTLRHRTFSAVRWTTVAAISRASLKFLQILVLVRLLSPEDYGLMAMVGVVLSFSSIFADLGLNTAYVQHRNVSIEQRSSLFWANIAMSIFLAILVILVSNHIALFFGDVRLRPLLMLSASTVILSALGQQLRMTAQKELDFGPVVLIEISAALVGFSLSVTLALLGSGVYALVWGAIASALSGSVFSWIFISRGWRPLLHFQLRDIRPYFGFGSSMVGNGIANQVNMTIDLMVGGRMLAASQLGLYSVPRNIMLQVQSVVNPIATRVGFPLIAEVQNDISRVREIYLKTVNMSTSTNAPLYIAVMFYSTEIVDVFLGANWREVDDLMRILALWGLFRTTGNPVGSLLLGMGRAKLSLQWNVALLLIVPPVIYFASSWGTHGIAWSLAGIQIAAFIPAWLVLVRPLCHSTLREYLMNSIKPMLIAVASIAPSYLLTAGLDIPTIRLAVAASIAAPTYVGMSYIGNRDWIKSILELLKSN